MSRILSRLGERPAIPILVSFGLLIALGPSSSPSPSQPRGAGFPFSRALFMATSAVCVTGLSVVDVGLEITPFGQ